MAPLYDFDCESCGTTVELLLDREVDAPPCTCCDGNLIRREVQSGSTFHLKEGGCGWADTGYSTHYGDAVKYGKH